MENVKKKRQVNGDGRTSGKTIRAKEGRFNGGVTVEDAELEEFLAIINRLQEGFDHFKNNKEIGDGVTKLAAMDSGNKMNMGFEMEDFMQFEDGRRKTSAGDVLRNDAVLGFDLNADPMSD